MDDPFLEVGPDYTTMPVKLYNKFDLQLTPWHYATNYVEDNDGFSLFMSNDFDKNKSFLQNINYITLSESLYEKYSDSEKKDARNSFDKANVIPFLMGDFVDGMINRVIIMPIVEFLRNDYTIQRYDYVSSLSIYLPGSELLKTIELADLEEQDELINVFDITGMGGILIKNNEVIAKGKLIKKIDIDSILYKCNENHLMPYEESPYKIIRQTTDDGCGAIEVSETEDAYNLTTHCSGGFPTKNKINLKYNAYSLCQYDPSIWPDQAGMKPLEFSLSESVAYELENSSTLGKYKTITFYPTLDDSIETIDPAFDGASPINLKGKFRFEFHKAPEKEIINVDLNTYSCSTDSDKLGKTGPGAVPNVSLDWDWTELTDVDQCQDKYCDATQISQVILNRINESKELIETQNISCPKSNQQAIDEELSGTYEFIADPSSVNNTIPPGKVGIQAVNLGVIEDNFQVKVSIENNTIASTTGIVNVSLANKQVISIEYIDSITGETIIQDISQPSTNNIYTKDINVSTGNNNTFDLIFTFNDNEMGDDLPLIVTYTGAQTAYSTFNTLVTLQDHPSAVSGCLVPATTLQFNGTDYIDFWFNKNQYPSNVISEWSSEDILALKNLLSFNAYLITDNYNKNFQEAFDKAYGGRASINQGLGTYSFMASPSLYSEGYLSPLFKDNLEFILKYSMNNDGVKIKTPGLYNIRIDLIFNNENWDFTTNTEDVDANVVVTFTYLKGPSDNSVFYRLPFDGFVGYESNGYNRQGYGVAYLGDDILITKIKDNDLRTTTDTGSNPLRYLRVNSQQDIFKLNSDIESRGSVLKILNQEDNQTELIFSPSIATPVIMKVENNNLEPFSVFYQLIKDSSSEPITGSSNLTKWNGIGDGCDYSGDYIYSIFNNVYDNQSLPEDRLPGAYKIDWSTVNSKGNVYLRTIFYTPINDSYTLNSTGNRVHTFSYDGDDYVNSISIPNKSNNVLVLNSIKDVFENISSGNICVANSSDGTYSEFFYNPVVIYGNNSMYTTGPEDRLKCN